MRNLDFWESERNDASVLNCGLKYRMEQNLCYGDVMQYSLRVWKPKALKPYINLAFKSAEQRDGYFDSAVKRFKEHKESKKAIAEERKKVVTDAKVGDVYSCSWGYDQTNYDFIVILEVSETKKTVVAQRAMSKVVERTLTTDGLKPSSKGFGDKFRLKASSHGTLVGSYPYCHDGTGSKRCGYFSKTSENRVYHETNAYSGH